jgi:HEAT repeat protein
VSLQCLTLLQDAELASQSRDWPALSQLLAKILWDVDGSEPRSLPFEGKIAAHCLRLALQVLEFGDFQTCWDLAKIFAKLGSDAIAPLQSLAQNPDAKWESRWFAIRILGEFRDPSIPVNLVNLLQSLEPASEDDDEDLSATILESLSQHGAASVTALQALLNDDKMRLMGVQTLAQIRTSATITPLLTVVNDPNPTIRAIALEALASFHDSAIPPILIKALRDHSSSVRCVAVAGLGMRPDLTETFSLISQLTPFLWDIHPDVCQHAAISLGRLRQASAIPALVKSLATPSTTLNLQLTIVRAISWIPDSNALTALQTLLLAEPSTLSIPVLTEIATVLGHMSTDPEQAAAIAIQALEISMPHLQAVPIRQALIYSLGQLHQAQAIETLVHCLTDSDPTIQLHASAALKHCSEMGHLAS